MSRALSGGIPRAFADGRSRDARAYRRYCVSVLRRLGTLTADGLVTLREAGRLTVELEAMGRELEGARRARRRRDVARLRRLMVPARTQLMALERRLEEIAANRPRSFAAAVRAAGGQQ